ncbi:MAG: hypothetical protein PHQ42_00535 [Patescibacteria group bacterium]|nr:hypothetical protein [Patescibacteria group bacterium]
MAPYEEKGKIMKFFSYLSDNIFFVFAVLALVGLSLSVIGWFFLPAFFSLAVCLAVVIGLAVFVSYKKNVSIPLVSIILKREYYRAKFKYLSKKNKKTGKQFFIRFYLKILFYLILLFENSEEGFSAVKEEAFSRLDEILSRTEDEKMEEKYRIIKRNIARLKAGEKLDSASLADLEKELFEFSKFKQKKATVFSLTALTIIIITTVITGLISSFLFPEVFKTRAASYGFIQTDWSGGVSSDSATHSDQTGWTKYFSKDNVSTSTPGELSLSLTTSEIWSQTSDEDWQTHATSSTYYLDGSVGIAKPNGITCSSALECDSGFCVDGVCCDGVCEGVCKACNLEGSVGTCTNRSADDTTEGCSDNCYDCVDGECVAVTEDSDGTCVTCRTCVDGSCVNRAIDTQPSGCNSTCQYCDGSGNCRTMYLSQAGPLCPEGNAQGVGVAVICKPSLYNNLYYALWSGYTCGDYIFPGYDCGGGNPNAFGYSYRCLY